MTGAEIAAIISAAASTASAGASAAMGIKSVKKQKRVMRYQDSINDANYAKQLADQRQLIDEERAYNDYGSIMSRASAAGVNPLYALGAGPSGGNISTSTPSQGDVSIPQDLSAAHMSDAMHGFSTASSAMLDLAVKDEQIEGLQIDNERKDVDLEMAKKDLEDKDRAVAHKVTMDSLAEESKSLQNSAQKLQNDFDSATFEDRVLMVGQTLEQAREQNRILDEEYKQKKIDTEFYRTEKDVAIRSSLVGMNYQIRMMTKADEEEFHRAFVREIESANLSLKEKSLAETIAKNIADHNLDVAKLIEKIQNETTYSDGFVGSILRIFDNALTHVPGSKTYFYRRYGQSLEQQKR